MTRTKPGRPATPHDAGLAVRIQSMAEVGSPLEDIASICGISVPTLRKVYRKELKNGAAIANMKVGRRLFEKCMQGDTASLIFWAKTRMGWREKDKKEIKTTDLGTIASSIKEAFRSVG